MCYMTLWHLSYRIMSFWNRAGKINDIFNYQIYMRIRYKYLVIIFVLAYSLIFFKAKNKRM